MVRLGFFTVFRRDPGPYVQAERMIQSARQHMPGVEIVQFTDETSPPVLGVDRVQRLPSAPMLALRLQHYCTCDGDWMLVDSDVLFKGDVRDVFDQAFDVALCYRDCPHLQTENAEMVAKGMPYNTGVAFSRNPEFWLAVYAQWQMLSEEQRRDWLSEQLAVAKVVPAQHHLTIRVKSSAIYNFPPSALDTPGIDTAKILHFKGPRKDLMLQMSGVEPKTLRPITPVAIPPAPPASTPMLRVFIGLDPRQPLAFHTMAHSIYRRSSVPVSVTALNLSTLPITRRGLTEFTYTRFLVPWLCGYEGTAVFADADMFVRDDLAHLVAAANPDAAVSVVPHSGDLAFERASVMVFNCAKCTTLTPEFVEDSRHGLFDLKWAPSMGVLPPEWNHLVGYHAPNPNAKLVHFTMGLPIWPETKGCEFTDEWHAEFDDMRHSVTFQSLMGQSVHVRHLEKLAKA